MSQWGRYNDKLLYWEYLVASRDEIDIEAEVWLRLQRRKQDSAPLWLADQKHALLIIDQLKISGEYERERVRLAGILSEIEPATNRPPLNPDVRERLDKLDNLFAGLESPDAVQRAKFERFYLAAERDNTKLAEMALDEAFDLIDPLEKAKRRKGRRAWPPPWRALVPELDFIRREMVAGRSLFEAAKKAAKDFPLHAAEENRAEHLRDNFRERLKLRN